MEFDDFNDQFNHLTARKIEKFKKQLDFEEEWKNRWMNKYKNLTKKQRFELVKRIKQKYDSDEYQDKEYALGYEPRYSLYDVILWCGEKYGEPDPEGINGCFPEDRYIVDDRIVIGVIYGQGSYLYLEILPFSLWRKIKSLVKSIF